MWTGTNSVPLRMDNETLDPARVGRDAGRIADVEQLNRRLADCTQTLTTADLATALNSIGVPIAKVNTLRDVLEDPLLKEAFAHARDERSGTELILPPLAEVGAIYELPLRFPPRLGEHNAAIYGGVLGYGAAKVSDLRSRGII